MSLVEAHLLCVALLVLDQIARAWRIRILVHGLGKRLGFIDSIAVNAIGDAAAALTPLRFAGEPVRLGVMVRHGVPATIGLAAIGLEVLTMWPVIILAAVVLGLLYAPTWLREAGPQLAEGAEEALPWVLVIALVTVGTWAVARRFIPRMPVARKRAMARALIAARRISPLILLATVPLTLVNLAGRVGILVVLTRVLPDPPPAGLVAIGSFLLLYSQIYLPTPSGAGAVELGFLGGAAGQLGAARHLLLVTWRFYTTLVAIVLGLVLAARTFGPGALRWLMGRSMKREEHDGREEHEEI